MDLADVLAQLGCEINLDVSDGLEVDSPVDGSYLGSISMTPVADSDSIVDTSVKAAKSWRSVPAPVRGELVRLFGSALRENKEALGMLVSIETGKILSEGLGEVQEMIDICDFAVGQSRQLYGLTIASERPGHHMREMWHPLGVSLVISAFNFPVAVWSWNTALSLVCGNSVIWKPSEKAPLCAIAAHKLLIDVIDQFEEAPSGLSQLVIGGRDVGEALVANPNVALVSATGSTRMGREVSKVVSGRFGKVLLELGGNNAAIIAPSADLDLAVRAIVFAAAGTAGQRCTTLRRLIVHKSIVSEVTEKLKAAYAQLRVGSPLDEETLVGPLIDGDSVIAMQQAINEAKAAGATVYGGESIDVAGCESGHYVQPCIVESDTQLDVACRETFAPITYVVPYSDLSEAIELNNTVPQGLSSSIFTTDVREAELFTSAVGSDCGIANVNIGPSGAEIGGAFGGEKETGGGRESGSDAWRAYMRRQTVTVNYSSELPLAQGVNFDLGGS